MKNQQFVHLHVHSNYSYPPNGLSSIKQLVDKAIACHMPGMALTDNGNMFGSKEFFDYCNEVNQGKADNEKFKPIFGCEVYCARRGLHSKENVVLDGRGWHLVLLAKNEKGYHNLMRIVNEAWNDGYYVRPRTDHNSIEKYHEGLIATSACFAGEIPSYISKGQSEEAKKAIEWFKRVFGDDFYIELMRHEVKDSKQRANRDIFEAQKAIEPALVALARKHNVKLICSNDSLFADKEDAEVHDDMICAAIKKEKNDPSRILYSKQEWLKTPEEMAEVFFDNPEALANTIEIFNKVEMYHLDQFQEVPSDLKHVIPNKYK